MFKSICNFFSRVFHRHDWYKTGFHQDCEGGVRFSVRHYKCKVCGKEIKVDGRYDVYAKA